MIQQRISVINGAFPTAWPPDVARKEAKRQAPNSDSRVCLPSLFMSEFIIPASNLIRLESIDLRPEEEVVDDSTIDLGIF